MKNIITTALLCAAAVSANAAWSTSQSTSIWEQNTSTMTYSYTEDSKIQLVPNRGGLAYWETEGASQQIDIHCPDSVKIDFAKNARYELTYKVRVYGNLADGSFPYVNLTLVDSGNSVSMLFGNSKATDCQFGAILNRDVTTSPQKESLPAESCGTRVWSTLNQGPLSSAVDGLYSYRLIFETFEDSTVKDKIYFGVTTPSGSSKSFLLLNSGHIGMGGDTTKVFDDIGFSISGADFTSDGGSTLDGLGGVKLIAKDSTFTTWTREHTPVEQEQPNVPEPSAFGLLAGLGAIALAASRRRRSR
ncbi:MAG: PEP-CTERM sorting domain-containing protein [Opitutales bacterium]|nr:PEP-CTERM sorting domain-containing protein [Opitutales bacterium]